jgi:hypothetical protein
LALQIVRKSWSRARSRTVALSLGWLISFTYRRLIANPDPPLPARGEPQWAAASA